MSKTNIAFSEKDIEILNFSYKTIDNWKHRNLSLPYWKIIHNNKGISELFFKKNIKQRRISLPRSSILLIPPNKDFSCYNSSPISHLDLNFVISGFYISVKKSFFSFPNEGDIQMLIEDIHLNQDSRSLFNIKLIVSLLNGIPKDSLELISDDKRINRAISLMKQNLDKPLSNCDLAIDASMSVNGFARLFREQTDYTPYEYQTILRIEKACIMLQMSNNTIEFIANACGFTNRFHFSKSFKINKNKTPIEYRKLFL
ncbi:MAG: helix-turn-helix domain-containing protein [Spirochaetaceae bacterium]|jgi:AraC-like DNA-binding protein|nr:helix-turn-helix domain-containing protein [Spirochaetaceae bacterium]